MNINQRITNKCRIAAVIRMKMFMVQLIERLHLAGVSGKTSWRK